MWMDAPESNYELSLDTAEATTNSHSSGLFEVARASITFASTREKNVVLPEFLSL